VIFNVSGTQVNPVRDVTIRGLTIRDAALTYLGTTAADVHYIPSDSEWAVQRSGAVLLEGTEGVVFASNELTRCDGNGLFLSNYNRNTTIRANEFSWSESLTFAPGCLAFICAPFRACHRGWHLLRCAHFGA
jgi:hypothetical protein